LIWKNCSCPHGLRKLLPTIIIDTPNILARREAVMTAPQADGVPSALAVAAAPVVAISAAAALHEVVEMIVDLVAMVPVADVPHSEAALAGWMLLPFPSASQ
jgi:hypothetical protein